MLAKTQVADRDGETILRRPGDINGWDFGVDNCKNCQIMIFDRVAGATYFLSMVLCPARGRLTFSLVARQPSMVTIVKIATSLSGLVPAAYSSATLKTAGSPWRASSSGQETAR